jgi:hypothetical protein
MHFFHSWRYCNCSHPFWWWLGSLAAVQHYGPMHEYTFAKRFILPWLCGSTEMCEEQLCGFCTIKLLLNVLDKGFLICGRLYLLMQSVSDRDCASNQRRKFQILLKYQEQLLFSSRIVHLIVIIKDLKTLLSLAWHSADMSIWKFSADFVLSRLSDYSLLPLSYSRSALAWWNHTAQVSIVGRHHYITCIELQVTHLCSR